MFSSGQFMPILTACIFFVLPFRAQEIDPCRYIPEQSSIHLHQKSEADSNKKHIAWGLAELELKPDVNLLFAKKSGNTCKMLINSTNRATLNAVMGKTCIELIANQRIGGTVYPDSLRKLSHDDVRVQVNFSKKSDKPLIPVPYVQAEISSALFKVRGDEKTPGIEGIKQGFLLPGRAVISAGMKSEDPGKGSVECGIAGVKIDWLRRKCIDSVFLGGFPNLTAPSYRSINGGVQLTTRWDCALGKYLKLEHSSRIFKPLFPTQQKPDVELINSILILHGKNVQTRIRQTYTFKPGIDSMAEFMGEVVMGYTFYKQTAKK